MPRAPFNTDEFLANSHSLPPLFAPEQRDEVLRLFADHIYGETPLEWPNLRFEIREETIVFDGLATRQLLKIGFDKVPQTFLLLLYVPRNSISRGTFLGLNFKGIHTVTNEDDVPISELCSANPRGLQVRRWPIETILKRGFALATACYHDIEPDQPDGWRQSFRRFLPASNWGALGVWAWGLSRCLDVLEQIGLNLVAVCGHSRLGKAALWAGAQDERFAMVISNNSGCGGASPSRRNFGESVDAITKQFPHWFAPQFAAFRGRENELPIDQHHLLSLVAPRPLYVASAQEDLWADPRGEFLSCVAASPQWENLGERGLETAQWPAVHQPVGHTLRYHLREGIHDVTLYDWERWLDFAEESWPNSLKSVA
jgi:hypothetical protein